MDADQVQLVEINAVLPVDAGSRPDAGGLSRTSLASTLQHRSNN
jgi:hypothetical protein